MIDEGKKLVLEEVTEENSQDLIPCDWIKVFVGNRLRKICNHNNQIFDIHKSPYHYPHISTFSVIVTQCYLT